MDLIIKEERIDPTLLLPEEPMSYEIKNKKKKKKRKKKDQDQEDPFQGINDDVKQPVEIVHAKHIEEPTFLDPEITIKEEDMDFDFSTFADNDIQDYDENQEPAVSLDPHTNQDGVILTFKSLFKEEKIKEEKIIKEENETNFTVVKDEPDVDIEELLPKKYRKPKSQIKEKVCKVCHLVFINVRTLQIHQMKKHQMIRKNFTYKCEECGLAYAQKFSYDTHMKRKHSANSKPLDTQQRPCDECGLLFKGIGRLRIHKQRKHGSFKDAFNYVCKDCGLTYDKRRSLVVHRLRKHLPKPEEEMKSYVCPVCGQTYTRRDTYARHVQRSHHAKRDEDIPSEIMENVSEKLSGEVECKLCAAVFSNLKYLKLHLRRKHNEFKEEYNLKCTVCDMPYNKLESLKQHMHRKHLMNVFYCNTCDKQFGTEEELKNHSHDPNVFECHICGHIYASKGGLGKHLKCTHKLNVKPKSFTCSICNTAFETKDNMKKHIRQVHMHVTYDCKNCNKSYKTKESYRKHNLKFHTNNLKNTGMKLLCAFCPKLFSNETALNNHVSGTHPDSKIEDVKVKLENDEKKLFQCTRCPHSADTFEELRSHFDKTHHKADDVQCPTCGKFISEKMMARHLKMAHPVTTNMKCSYCDFETTSKLTLTQHVLTHPNIVSMSCDYQGCRYKSFYPEAMEKHKQKHVELGSSKLQCYLCPFQTMNKYILKYHEDEHATGEKKYKCDKCNYATILPANLVQHKYKHSQVKRFKCEYCPFATKYNTSLRFHVRKKHLGLTA